MIVSLRSLQTNAALQSATAKVVDGATSALSIVEVGGDWRLGGRVPSWDDLFEHQAAATVRVSPKGLGNWDTSLLLFLVHGRTWCAASQSEFQYEALPEKLKRLLRTIEEVGAKKPPTKTETESCWAFSTRILGKRTNSTRESISFLGECTLGVIGLAKKPQRFRWMDCVVEMQHCWSSSLPIVSLVSFLVGVILAFQAAIQLQKYGAAIFVADLVGLSVVREMGPMMAAVIVAGGIGAAFAAELGNMRVDEEIDALETLGISAVDFLALPRLLAITLMMPILALYADVLGILGGMFVSATMLNIPATAYWIETQNRVGIPDVGSGVIKSVFFGLAVGLSGCLRGIKCERSASGVGRATTSAAVTGILLIVIGDAVFALLFKVLGI